MEKLAMLNLQLVVSLYVYVHFDRTIELTSIK